MFVFFTLSHVSSCYVGKWLNDHKSSSTTDCNFSWIKVLVELWYFGIAVLHITISLKAQTQEIFCFQTLRMKKSNETMKSDCSDVSRINAIFFS